VKFEAVESFYWGQRYIGGGDVVSDIDPAVVKFPHLFVPVEGEPEPEVEAEVVAPVKRGPGRPKKIRPEVEAD
jgi:hypothetical protein